METVVSILKISGVLTALIAVMALALHLIFNKRSFFRLYRRGYMVTHPGHKAVMFKKLTDARSFIKRSAKNGNDCNIYLLENGQIHNVQWIK